MARLIAMHVVKADTWSREICRGIADYARRQNDWRLLLAEDIRVVVNAGPDGMLGTFTANQQHEQLDVWRDTRLPWVNLSNYMPPTYGVNVHSDEHAIGRLAAETFIDLGFRQFAFVGRMEMKFAHERLAGFRDCVESAGHSLLAVIDAGLGQFEEKLGRLPRQTAVFAATDLVAQQIIQSCLTLGIDVPEHLSVVGVDNDELTCEWSRVTISSVRPDFQRVGFEAAALLHRLMDGDATMQRTLLIPPAGVVSRRSTDTLAADDDIVRQAMALIRDQACQGLRVADVADALPVSRRSLERRFLAAMGRSPHDEIRAARLRRARDLLRETDMKVLAVALTCGVSDQRRFARDFKAAYGETPSAFRRSCRV